MGKVFAMPARPAEPETFDLFAVLPGITSTGTGPRDAEPEEVRRYLLWQAERYGVELPDNASFGPAGISVGGKLVVPMPGHGQSPHVTCELLDDAGAVVKTMPLPVDRRGKLPMNAAQVQEWTGLAPVRRARKPKAPKPAAVAAVEPQEANSAPLGPEVPSDIAERLAALEAAVTRLVGKVSGRRVRSDAERRAIVRAWRIRCAARAQADLDRRALLASREQYLKLAAERDALRASRSRTASRLARTRRERFDLGCALIAAQDELAPLRPLGAAIRTYAAQAFPSPKPTRRKPQLAAVA